MLGDPVRVVVAGSRVSSVRRVAVVCVAGCQRSGSTITVVEVEVEVSVCPEVRISRC